jgi:alpha-beta hydrolase superfamily lysophospholipase
MSSMAGFDEIELSLPDGYRAYGRYWRAEKPRGAVLYHHGIQSHCGWYEGSARALSEAGYHVLQVDRRGCGRNELERGHADSADQLIADAHAARDELTRRSNLPTRHVLGVSWGGKLAVAAHVDDPAGTESLTLVAPGLFPLVGVTGSEMTKIGIAMLYEPNERFDIPLDDPENFSALHKWQAFVATDPLTLRQCSAGFYLASRRMDRLVAKLGSLPPIPVHLLLAGDERIIDNDKTVQYAESLAWPDVTVARHEQSRHAFEFDSDPQGYYHDLVTFMENMAVSSD